MARQHLPIGNNSQLRDGARLVLRRFEGVHLVSPFNLMTSLHQDFYRPLWSI